MASFTFYKTGLFRHTYRLCDTPEDTYRALEEASPEKRDRGDCSGHELT